MSRPEGARHERVKNFEWVEQQLRKLDFVRWDRFTIGEWNGQCLNIYGWIDRDDEHEDFVLLILWPEGEGIYFTTSSAEYTAEIDRRLFGEPEDQDSTHMDCLRVEHTFRVGNVVELEDGESDD